MKYKIEDLLEKVIDNRGKTPPTSTTGHMLLEINSLTGDNKYPNYGAVQKIVSKETYNTWFRSGHPQVGDILIPTVGTLDALAYLNRDDCCIAQNIIAFRTKKEICDGNFLYYLLRDKRTRARLLNLNIGGVQPSIKVPHLKQLGVEIPDLKTQKKIVRTLSALDQKIELNNQQNETLFELGRQLYIEKFENNQTIDKVELGIFFPVITGKKDANASSKNGKYPFFTCSKTISKIDDYVFDSSAILLAGNGDFNVKFYRGKFDAYQRTYVLIPNNPEYLGFLYWAISYSLPKITANYRGSVIKFITKGNIENFKVPFADNKYIPVFMKYLEKIEKNNQQNEVLAGLRDALLPKLMSGEINLEKVEI